MNITGLLLDALPPGLLTGIVIGAILTTLIGGAVAYVASFLLRHWKPVLLVCAVIVTGVVVLVAL